MRTIKYRGQRVDNGKWVYGDLIHITKDFKKIVLIIDWATKQIAIEVNPETVGQFPVLTDKRGVEIYEGDIIRFCDDLPNYSDYIVKYDEERMIWIADGAVGDYMEDLWELECEFVRVIGNIHDNPEMLES